MLASLFGASAIELWMKTHTDRLAPSKLVLPDEQRFMIRLVLSLPLAAGREIGRVSALGAEPPIWTGAIEFVTVAFDGMLAGSRVNPATVPESKLTSRARQVLGLLEQV
jgi:hypothetical protein